MRNLWGSRITYNCSQDEGPNVGGMEGENRKVIKINGEKERRSGLHDKLTRPCTQHFCPVLNPLLSPDCDGCSPPLVLPFPAASKDSRGLCSAVTWRDWDTKELAVLACRPISGWVRLLFQLPPPYAKFSEHLAIRRCVMRIVPSLRVLISASSTSSPYPAITHCVPLCPLCGAFEDAAIVTESPAFRYLFQSYPIVRQTLSKNFSCNCRRGVWIMHASNVSITLLQAAHLSTNQIPGCELPENRKCFAFEVPLCQCLGSGGPALHIYRWPHLTLSFFNYRSQPDPRPLAINRHNPEPRMSKAESNSPEVEIGAHIRIIINHWAGQIKLPTIHHN